MHAEFKVNGSITPKSKLRSRHGSGRSRTTFPPLSWWLATIDGAAGSGDHLETRFTDGCQFSIIDGGLPFLYVSRKETMHAGKLRKLTGKKQKSDMKFRYPLIAQSELNPSLNSP